MATNGNSHVNVKQGLAKPGTMDGQQGNVQQPEALPHTVVQQDISQVPLLLHWPTVIVPLNYVPANLNPHMTITFSWNPSQPVTIPCVTSNMILDPCICSIPLVVPSHDVVNEWGRGPWKGWASWMTGGEAHRDGCLLKRNGGWRAHCGQRGVLSEFTLSYLLHYICDQGPDNADQTNDVISTQTNDVANQQGLEVNTQLPGPDGE
ncbi:uncharacterized protein LOC130868256 isoform X1 [Chionomys nivalis]|uniref:uncharacterized protein LOC130868256 isoform X1 n=1 Tax=Chionomys nivalis TaxID=269649 RepID=UPI0025929EC1|nr:uncharacterized protein LOC130868256 isoform X1 [Chionomys nivalis]XP_057616501.1 uncharacterized protein LOC130868256 isoform X1 [Chionomys nivalis]